MEPNIFRFILRYSKKEQVILLITTVASFPFLYYSLELPKIIINEAIGGSDFPREAFGYTFDQVPFLLTLCGIFLTLVFVNGGFKYFLNVYRGTVGERMLRRLRYQLFDRVLRFPLPQFRRTSQGEVVSMITAETEPLGGFVGDSLALPAYQGGTMLTILVFMFVQDWILGLAAIALYPLQGYIIPKLQRQVNLLKKARTVEVRKLSERIGEVVTGIQEVHAHDTSRLELADFSQRMWRIFGIRLDIYRRKFFIKFINNFIDKLTPFFFYSIGGYLVIQGELTFGALVAVLAAYKDISAPWKELLRYYQTKEDARIKYDLLVENFQPPGMLDERMQALEPEDVRPLTGEVVATNLNLEEDLDQRSSAVGARFKFELPQLVALLGPAGSGKDQLAALLAGLVKPRIGSISIGGMKLAELPESVTGRRIGYATQEPRLRAGTLGENLLYSLKHRPRADAEYDDQTLALRQQYVTEARRSGNAEHDVDVDWLDYEAAGVAGPEDLTDRVVEVLRIVDMDEDVYQLGLRSTLDPERFPGLPERLLHARAELKQRLEDPEIAPLVELFDETKYNTNMSVAENLLFGTPRDPSFDVENLPENAYVRKVLHETGLISDFLRIGRRLAELMVDLFTDVPPDSELFEQFSFISAEDLPEFKNLLARTDEAHLETVTTEDRHMLLLLPFKLTPARHRLGLIDEWMQDRILAARRVLAEGFGMGAPPVEFFDPGRFNSAISIQDNILFGRLAYGKARGAVQIGALIGEVVEKLELRRVIIEAGLEYQVGIAGARLTGAQRQKLSLARCVLKRPDYMVLDEATAALDNATQDKIMQNLFKEFSGRGVIWGLHRAGLAEAFDYSLVLENGRVVEHGRFSELDKPGNVLNQLVAAG